VEFLTGIIFILVAPESGTAALLVQICIAGFYGVVLVANLLANEHTADAVEKRKPQIEYIKSASMQVKLLLGQIQDKEARKKVEKVYDTLYSSPVKSHAGLEQMEKRILQSISEFEGIVSRGDKEKVISSANALLAAVNERNLRLKN
jgi:hypothetical protein